MLTQGLVVFFALCAAVCAAVGIVIRQRATTDVPPEKGVSTVMIATLLRRKLWWAGTAVAVAGYVFQALALIKGSLLLVQPLLVSALLFALPLSARLAHRRVTRAEWLWAVLLTISLAVFVVVARPHTPEGFTVPVSSTTIAMTVCAVFVVSTVVVAVRKDGTVRAVLLALAVGVLFGVVAVLTKIVVHLLNNGTVGELMATPAPYALVLVAVVATLLQQSAFHAGALQTSVPTMLVLEPVVAVLLGAFVIGEQLDATGIEAVILTLTVASMAAATVALGRDAGAYEEMLEARTAKG